MSAAAAPPTAVNGIRSVSGSSATLAPPTSDSSALLSSSPAEDDMSGFNRTISSATTTGTAGKSGRVIEKLMAENDRLRRELKVETTARDEERKAKEALRQQRDNLQSTNDNLILQSNIDRGVLARKERKIEELKTQKDQEAALRQTAEGGLRIAQREADEAVHDLKAQLSNEAMERKRAENQYEVLKESLKKIEQNYKTKVDKLRNEIEEYMRLRENDAEVLRRLEVTREQQQQELGKMRVAKTKITQQCTETLKATEEQLSEIRTIAKEKEEEMTKTVEEARETFHKMRHIIGVHQAFGEESPLK